MPAPDYSLYDHVAEAVFVLEPDADGIPRFVFANAQTCKCLGMPPEAFLGKTAQDLYANRLGAAAMQHQLNALSTGEMCSYEITNIVFEREVPVCTTILPILNEDGSVARLVCTSREISSVYLLRRMQTQMDLIVDMIEDVVNLTADETGRPAQHVTAVAELLREDFHDFGDGKLELIALLEDVATRTVDLVGETLQQAETVIADENERRYNLRTLVHEVLGLVDPLDQCDLSCDIEWVQGNRLLAETALTTLVKDIFASLPCSQANDGPRLCLGFHVADVDGCFIEITMRDNTLTLNGAAASAPVAVGPMLVSSAVETLERILRSHDGTLSKQTRPNGAGAEYVLTLPGYCLDAPSRSWAEQSKAS